MAKIKYAIIDDGGMLNGKLFAYADDEQKLVADDVTLKFSCR